MGTGNAGKVTGSLWRRCSEPHTTENESGPIRFEKEMGTPTCVHRLKVYLFILNLHNLGSFMSDETPPIDIPDVAKKHRKKQARIRIPCQCKKTPPDIHTHIHLLNKICGYFCNDHAGSVLRRQAYKMCVVLSVYNGDSFR